MSNFPHPAHNRLALLVELYEAAVAAVDPGPVLVRALQDEPLDNRVWVVALGKAAQPMAEAAVQVLVRAGKAPAGGLVVPPQDIPSPHAAITVVAGDHPEPGARSLAAAAALERVAQDVAPGDTVWVLLSGGTTSLIAAPQPGITASELTALYGLLLRSGLDIRLMNRVRKRFTRWGAGRLARSLERARVRCYVVSDVIGDELADIGSGPCVPDTSTAPDVREALVLAGLWDRLAAPLRRYLEAVEQGSIPETPKAGDSAFARVESRIIASNRVAMQAAAAHAITLGLSPELVESPLAGEAAVVGARLGERLLAGARAGDAIPQNRCVILGGETTVTISEQAAGIGGRCQELALAAARALRGAPRQVALLAAGTDGRDGPTDAAGAVVDGTTWDAVAAAGRDPEQDLLRHDAYAALDAASALLRTGPTGTNVMDLVIGLQ